MLARASSAGWHSFRSVPMLRWRVTRLRPSQFQKQSPLRLASQSTYEHRQRSPPQNIRLVNVDSFELSEPHKGRYSSSRDYAILSHTWREDRDEVSLNDLQRQNLHRASARPAFNKIRYINEQAKRDGLQYFWVDTCCIDQTSSAELTEAINSMYKWYARARVCYVYIADVNIDKVEVEEGLKRSRWFTRAWTLQELLASRDVEFYDANWKYIGHLSDPSFARLLADITGIDVNMLLHRWQLRDFSIAQRMSWAAHRQASRGEDRAYSLLGLFDVHMPMLYGEGSTRAFVRLQEEIIKASTDHSILCWEHPDEIAQSTTEEGGHENPSLANRSLFAPSPSSFAESTDIVETTHSSPRPYQMTNRGLEITLPIRSYWKSETGRPLTCAKLNCSRKDSNGETLVLNLERQYDLDAEAADRFKPWLRPWQRRRREAWDQYMGRQFDWHFVASYARRGFAIGHPPFRRRLQQINAAIEEFREQTVVLLRQPGVEALVGSQARQTANPLASFNELYVGIMCIYVAATISLSVTAYAYLTWSENNLTTMEETAVANPAFAIWLGSSPMTASHG